MMLGVTLAEREVSAINPGVKVQLQDQGMALIFHEHHLGGKRLVVEA